MFTRWQIETLRLILITSFGKKAARPMKAAIFRIILSIAFCIILSLMLVRAASHIQLPIDLPSIMVMAFFSSIAFVISGLASLIFSAAVDDGKVTANRILATLPLSRGTRILIQTSPIMFIAGLLLLILAPIAIEVAGIMNQDISKMLIGLTCGILSGCAIGFWRMPKHALLKPIIFTVISALCFYVLDQSIKRKSENLSALVIMVLILCFAGFGRIIFANSFSRQPERTKNVKLALGQRLLLRWWYIVKILRNRRSANTLLVCLAIVLVTSYIILKKHIYNLNGPIGLILFGVTITIAFACDIRGLARFNKTPEIFSLRGLNYFVQAEVLSTFLFSLLIGSPILFSILISSNLDSTGLILTFLGVQLFGGLVGLISSTMFVPQAGEIGPQFFAAALSLSLFFSVQRVTHILEYSPEVQIIMWSLLGAICIVMILIIEKIRISHYGRS